MIKTKFFFKDNLEKAVNAWLQDHQNIEIVSTNFTCNSLGWGYSILYKDLGDNKDHVIKSEPNIEDENLDEDFNGLWENEFSY